MEKTAANKLIEQGYETFLPMCINEKKHNKPEPLFPCYLFIRLQLGIDDIGPVRSTYGVQGGLVRFGSFIPEVPQEIIEQLKALSDGDTLHLDRDYYKPGELVRIKEGPFKLLSGVIEARSKGDRVWVLIRELGSHPIRLHIKDIENL